MMKKSLRMLLFFILLNLLSGSGIAQSFTISGAQKSVNIPFKIIRNMIIIQVNINEKGPFNFILDTGISFMIITDNSIADTIKTGRRRVIKLSGLGSGEDIEAYTSGQLKVDIGRLKGDNIAAAILKKDCFGLTNYTGIPIGGLLGYEFFSKLAVKINFNDTTLTVYDSKLLPTPKKYTQVPITIEENKPYLTALVKFQDGCEMDRKLIFDLGAGHPLSLENVDNNYLAGTQSITANLGIGFNGPIDGKISRISELQLGKYRVKDILASFPDTSDNCERRIPRDGNIGFDIIKRFNIIIDYPKSLIYLKPRYNIKDPFERDMSGMEYYFDGDEMNRLVISRVEPGSAADAVGLEKNDELTCINFKAVKRMTLDEIDQMFRSGDGRSFLLEVYRDKKFATLVLTLKKRI